MKTFSILMLFIINLGLSAPGQQQQPTVASDPLVGLWKAKRSFGPFARGPLLIIKTASGWKADFMGGRHAVTANGSDMTFRLPNNQGSFSGRLEAGSIIGHWVSGSASRIDWSPASPIVLRPAGPGRMQGTVTPPDNDLTWFLLVQKQPDGTFSAIMRNPERDLG